MKDLTFIIPIKIDTEDRIFNCSVILRFLNRYFEESEVLVIEMDAECRTAPLKKIASQASFHFIESQSHFIKSKVINYGIAIAKGKLFACMMRISY